MLKIQAKGMALAGYLFFAPALYVILTRQKDSGKLRLLADDAFFLWLKFCGIFILLRLIVNLLWLINYWPMLAYLEPAAGLAMAGYIVYRAFQAVSL